MNSSQPTQSIKMSQEECPCGMSHEWTSTDIILHLWYLIMLFFFSLFFFPLHLLYSIMPFFPPSLFFWIVLINSSQGIAGAQCSHKLRISVYRIHGSEDNRRRICPTYTEDHTCRPFISRRQVSRLTCNIFVMLILSMLTDLLMLQYTKFRCQRR